MKRPLFLPALILAWLCLAAPCLAAKAVDIVEPAVTSLSAYGNPSADQVRDAIVRAGSGIGWQMTVEAPDMVIGDLQTRGHSVTVEIPYSANGYVIKYRTSVNMNEKNGKIHPNYNRWVDRLFRHIAGELPRIQKN
ncbi:MAG: hypothetical protein LBC10_01075 [Deltaproteobacteria bacterium]|jgi:hypothetical protein|nr:hypothetical protein [Deltaproteobacteria bacterium]